MNKIDLQDMTFLIPIRLDSMVRLENMLSSIEYLITHFNTHILVLEASSYCNFILRRILPPCVCYEFIEDKDPIFYRTHYLNHMAKSVDTKYLAIWDADIIIHSSQIHDSIEKLRSQHYDIAFPYNGIFYDSTSIIREVFMQNKDINVLFENRNKMLLPYGIHTTGGAIFVNREKYIKAGMENEVFYGWSAEDIERFERWKILNYRIYRANGPLFHLSHPRDHNGKYNSNLQKRLTLEALNKVRKSTLQELLNSIKEEQL